VKAVSGGSNTAILVAVLAAVLITLSLVATIWMRLNESPGPSVNTATSPATTATITENMLAESMRIISAYAEGISGGWKITLIVENTGAVDVTIDSIFINGKPWSWYSGITISPPLPTLVKTGSEASITITIPGDTGFSSGQMIEVRLHSASGREYPKMVTLPAESIQIVSAYAEPQMNNGQQIGWTITLQVKNVGTTDATIDNIFINGKPFSSYNTGTAVISINTTITQAPLSISLKAGDSTTIIITIPKGLGFTPGQMVEIKLHTTRGYEYPKQVTLP